VSSVTPRAGNPNVRRAIIGVGLLVLIGVLAFQIYRAQQPPKGDDPHNDIPQLKATKYYDFVGGQHTGDPVHYDQVPPAGGPHDPTWDDCGAYTQPPRNENAVHDLEHGTVWITYQPGLDQADISSLQSKLEALKSGKWMLSPYPGLPSPVVVTVWNAQLDLTGADDPRLPIFLKFYGDGHTSPEGAFASCKGGADILASPDRP
jgi:Protein of unknown function (DUF3105)